MKKMRLLFLLSLLKLGEKIWSWKLRCCEVEPINSHDFESISRSISLGLFWKRMQDVVEPTRFICFPLCFFSFQGNYNWTRARSGSFEHPNFGYRMREVPIFGGTSIPPNGGTHWPTSRIVRGRVNGLERSSVLKENIAFLELHHFFWGGFPPCSFIIYVQTWF